MRATGYDRSFAPGALDRDDAPSATPYASIAMLDIDEEHHRVARPSHVQIDFGGFLKGLTVDRAPHRQLSVFRCAADLFFH
jgi:thiamine biosynthesis lipoprotein ApbE